MPFTHDYELSLFLVNFMVTIKVLLLLQLFSNANLTCDTIFEILFPTYYKKEGIFNIKLSYI